MLIIMMEDICMDKILPQKTYIVFMM